MGSHFFLKFSIRAGPNGAAPPVTAFTHCKYSDLTAGWVDRKLTSGGTKFNHVGWNIGKKSFLVLSVVVSRN